MRIFLSAYLFEYENVNVSFRFKVINKIFLDKFYFQENYTFLQFLFWCSEV